MCAFTADTLLNCAYNFSNIRCILVVVVIIVLLLVLCVHGWWCLVWISKDDLRITKSHAQSRFFGHPTFIGAIQVSIQVHFLMFHNFPLHENLAKRQEQKNKHRENGLISFEKGYHIMENIYILKTWNQIQPKKSIAYVLNVLFQFAWTSGNFEGKLDTCQKRGVWD